MNSAGRDLDRKQKTQILHSKWPPAMESRNIAPPSFRNSAGPRHPLGNGVRRPWPVIFPCAPSPPCPGEKVAPLCATMRATVQPHLGVQQAVRTPRQLRIASRSMNLDDAQDRDELFAMEQQSSTSKVTGKCLSVSALRRLFHC
jgi:hypothetical protein